MLYFWGKIINVGYFPVMKTCKETNKRVFFPLQTGIRGSSRCPNSGNEKSFLDDNRDAEVHVHARRRWRTHAHARTRRRSHTLSLSVCVMFLALPLFVFAGRAKAEPARQTTTKRRKRKNSASSANSSVGTAAGKKRSPATNFSLSSQVPVSISSTRFASSYYVTLSFFFFFFSIVFCLCMHACRDEQRQEILLA